MIDLRRFLHPRSIAVIGASAKLESLSGQFLRNLKLYGYDGDIFPVNPKYREIGDFPCYPSVKEIPRPVDVAVIVAPKEATLSAIKECVQKKVPYAIVPAAGFAEAGSEGKELQRELIQAARSGGLRIMGPNCMGFANFKERSMAVFGAAWQGLTLRPGRVGVIAQSGAFGGQTARRCLLKNIGLSYFVSTGNEADLGTLDFIEALVQDPDTEVIAVFLEGIQDGPRLVTIGREALRRGKTIIVLKAGKSERGREAVVSHTGRMAGMKEVYGGVFKQAGIIEVEYPQDFWDAIEAFSTVKVSPRSFGLGAIVASGGSGILACDYAEKLGLDVVHLQPESVERLSQWIPPSGSTKNPVDVTAQIPHNELEKFAKIVHTVSADPNVGVLFITIANAHLGRCWRDILEATSENQTLLAILKSDTLPEDAENGLRQSGRVLTAEDVWRVLLKVEFLKRRHDFFRLEEAPENSNGGSSSLHAVPVRRPVDEWEAKELLKPHVPVPRGEMSRSPEEAAEIAARIGYPVVMKLVGSGLKHKSEMGAVRLRVQSDGQLREEYAGLMETARNVEGGNRGVLIEEMVPGGVEVILGFIRYSDLGPVVMLGSGGVLVELLRDATYRSLPISRQEAKRMVEEVAISRLLKGFRGQPEKDEAALVDAITNLSQFFLANPWIRELELNPVVVLDKGKGVRILDALLA